MDMFIYAYNRFVFSKNIIPPLSNCLYRYTFPCQDWFSSTRVDGSTCRTLPEAGQMSQHSFSFRRRRLTRTLLYDDHLWISVFR